MKRSSGLSIDQVRALAKGEAVSAQTPSGTSRVRLRGVSGIEDAGPDRVVFAQDETSLQHALATPAGLVLANAALRSAASGQEARVMWVPDARLSFARVARGFQHRRVKAEIDSTAVIGTGCRLGKRIRIGPGVVLGDGVELGDDCELHARVVVYPGTLLGARVVVQAGAVLGSAGFGYVRDSKTGDYVLFPQQGRLIVEDDVSIGANCTLDGGALGETKIGRGTKIDNLVHIAHNCTIGRQVVIAAQTGIAGSSVVEDGAIIAGQVGIADHVRIGAGVVLGAKAGVPSNKRLTGAGQVFWGTPARPIQQYLRELARLRRGLKD